jgi:hypothetical protein
MVAPLIIAGGIAAGSALANYFANRSQAGAARDVASTNAALAREQMRYQREAAGLGRGELLAAQDVARGDLATGYNSGLASLMGGYDAGGNALRQGYSSAADISQQSRGRSLADLYGGLSTAEGSLLGGQYGAEDALLGAYGQTGSTNVELDPGMEFRRQQGEQALARASAASGGRVSGRSLQALANYNQGLASQEYGQAWQRANAQEQQRASILSQLAQSRQGGGQSLAGLQYGAGQQAAGIEQQYGAMDAGSQQAYGQQQSANLIGQGAAGYNAATGYGSQLANLGMNTAGQIASGYTGTAAQNAQLVPAMMQANQLPVQYAGAGYAAAGQGLNNLGQLYLLSQMYGGR